MENQTKGAMKINHVVKPTFSIPRNQVYIFIVSILVFLHFQAGSQSNVYENEKSILLELNQLWGDQLGFESLNSDSSYCNWFGVECRNGSVTSIHLGEKHLTGIIPPIICGLKSLEVIDLTSNNIRGEFPTYLYNCSKLKFLDLSWNQFHGPLPGDLNRLSRLVHLDIAGNSFTKIPGSIGQLSELEYLSLRFNNFNLSIPQEIGKLKKLKHLDITLSNLTGSIPETFSALSGLETLDLSGNYLNGSIPSYLFLSKKLDALYLQNNQFSGSLPNIAGNLRLQTLDLSGNHLNGSIPSYLFLSKKLDVLYLQNNQFSGDLPNITGNLRFPMLDLSGNHLNGSIPSYLFLSKKLDALYLHNNQFSGSLPNIAGNLRLQTLDLSRNHLNGSIPSYLFLSKKLDVLYLQNNQFSGSLPNIAGNLRFLTLDLSGNHLNGSIPSYLFLSKKLYALYLQNNQFSGSLPNIAGNLRLQTLDLSGNHLNGSIPRYLFLFKKLDVLYLQNNQFSGSLPTIVGNLRLTTLDVSSNRLSGYIPQEYDKGYSFSNNLNLCSSYTARYIRVPRCSSKTRVAIAIAAPIGFLLIVTLLCCVVKKSWNFSAVQFTWSKKRHENEDPEWMFISFQRLEFTESEILVNMTEKNLIGSGGSGKVYRVGVNPNGKFVAVKRIWNKRNLDNRLEKQFLAEVEVLGSIRHSNIVKLLCCISSGNSKILVYEYMENQSLDNWLHHKRKRAITASAHCVLEWNTRLQIAVGAARGLCYMHHECSPPIIHRDIKCGNILLDHELNAKIADFGLAKVLAKWGDTETASAISGTFGYLAPEYAYTSKVNVKSDVYSFGVVLLELVTGREPINRDEHMNLAQWAWNHHEEGNPIIDAFDEEIKEACLLKEMSSMFKLGLICTSSMPSVRPSMKEVLQILLLSVATSSSRKAVN